LATREDIDIRLLLCPAVVVALVVGVLVAHIVEQFVAEIVEVDVVVERLVYAR